MITVCLADYATMKEKLCTLKIGNIAKAYIQVQSKAESGIVGKLIYRAQGTFIITKDLGTESFEVQ